MAAAGAAFGSAVAPGIGTVVGGFVGFLLDRFDASKQEAKRVFVSFDYDHDVQLKHLFVGQARNDRTPFEIVDSSLLEEAPDDEWEEHAEEAISASDLVVVLLGKQTHRAHGVIKEVRIARRLGVPVVQVASQNASGARSVAGAGRRYPWSWVHLGRLLE